jgi:hypothetical protein
MRINSRIWNATRTKVLLIGVLAFSGQAYAQLHLIVGAATPNEHDQAVAASLLKINSDRSVELVEELASKKEGMWWIEAADDARTIAILTSEPESKVVVVDMNRGEVVKRCERWPAVPGYLSPQWATQYWLVADGTGKLWVGRYGSRGDPDSVLQGVSLDAGVPCEASFKMLGPTDVSKVYRQGDGGIGSLTGIEAPTFLVDAAGAVYTHIGGDRIYLGYTVPREYWSNLRVPSGAVWANNSKVAAVSYRDLQDRNNPGPRRSLAYDKVNKIWRELPWPGIPVVRAFGSTLAISEAVSPAGESDAAKTVRHQARSARDPARSALFEGVERRERLPLVYPGRLHVYDVATGQQTVIVTNEEDSEVLLVDGENIYYRVNDSIYSSRMGDSGVLPGIKIATDERIRDAHWAFMK